MLGAFPTDSNSAGPLASLPDEANKDGILAGLKDAKTQNLQKKQEATGADKDDGIKSHKGSADKGRKQSLFMIPVQRMLALRQQAMRVRAVQLVQVLKAEGHEIACGIAACNPDKGCDNTAFVSCIKQVQAAPAEEQKLLDMHRAEVAWRAPYCGVRRGILTRACAVRRALLSLGMIATGRRCSPAGMHSRRW